MQWGYKGNVDKDFTATVWNDNIVFLSFVSDAICIWC